MSSSRLILVTVIAMIAFAGNSLLCRLAFNETNIDAASFTTIRILSAVVMLAVVVTLKNRQLIWGGNWISAISLLAYAAGFSFAYLSLPAATGALLLFGAVQATMISYGVFAGELTNIKQFSGIALALGGLIVLFLPGLASPPLVGSLLMLGAGIAWGIYSLRGRSAGDATQETSGNFLRAAPLALVVSMLMIPQMSVDYSGIVYAVASGALASGIGYALWYSVLPYLKATSAATVQLSVPVITALGGVVLLGEPITFRLVLASCAILGGICIYILAKGDAAVAHKK
ncbi:DMT family transporter [Psychromonas sp. MME2]|uniref:DMT family transporter n=2 Tax=unclassified Psychromonas TaxID=2614957 RepID=UPI00339BB6D0